MGNMSTIDKILIYSSKLILIPALIYSIFLPLKLGTMWFYIGLPITLLGIIGGAMMLVDWTKTPPDRPVTRGLYHYSRHPMYVTEFIFFLGASIATASWLFFLFGLIFTVASAIYINDEEQITLEMYGDTYREYMNRTPRWLGIPKSEGTNA
jgi:protein-S-isoprenylcysteine O-methyltransferase Ste14